MRFVRISTFPASAWALAASSVSLFAVAVMAATPGSPYQPLLTPNGQPSGPLHGLAVAIGLDGLEGNAMLFVSTSLMVIATLAFLFLLREAFRGHVSVRAVAVVVIFGHALLLLVPLLFSRDVYSYAFYGRIAGVYGGNPYLETPLDHSLDVLWNFVGPKWVDTPAVYGPAWTSLSAGLSKVLSRPIDHVEAYRYIAIIASLAACAAIVWTVRRLWPERTAFALAAFGTAPVVLFHSVASGHNDLWLAFGFALALGFVARGREYAATITLTLAALVKATAGLPLLLLLVWVVARRPQGERRGSLVRHLSLVVGISLAFALPYLQLEDPSLGIIELSKHEGWLAASSGMQRLLDVLSFGTLGGLVRLAFAATLLVCVVGLVREVARRARSMTPLELGATWGWVLVLLTLLGPVLIPWYVVWALPLVWALPRLTRGVHLAVACLMGVTLWSTEPLRFPGAFELNLFVGRWIVTLVFVVLLWRLLLDLRERLRTGSPLCDVRGAVAPAPADVGDEERIPAAAGDGGDRGR